MKIKLVGRFVFRLVLASILIYSLVFLAFAVLPLDPARALLGPVADPSAVEALRARYGLDRPIVERFYLVAFGLMRGDFGRSVVWGQPVTSILGPALAVTLIRLSLALALGLATAAVMAPLTIAKELKGIRTAWMVVAGVPGFVVLVVFLALVGSAFSLPPSMNRWLYEILAILWAVAFTSAIISLSILERLDFRRSRSRQAEFLLFLRAPPEDVVEILMRSTWPTAFAATANAATGTLTVLAFAEYIFGLPGFAIPFFRASEQGDLAVVSFGSLFLAWCFLIIQTTAETAARWQDKRLN